MSDAQPIEGSKAYWRYRDQLAAAREDALARALAENERLRTAIARIDNINDNPAHFNSDINKVCDEILRPQLGA